MRLSARLPRFALALCATLFAAANVRAQQGTAPTWRESNLKSPRVGVVRTYVPHAPTAHIVILVSGADGWTPGLTQVARHLAARETIVIGVTFAALKRQAERDGGCWYARYEFELISRTAQKALNLPQYHSPAIVGYQAGGSIVYAAIANTDETTFVGAVSLAFSPLLHAAVSICGAGTWEPEYDSRRRVSELPRVASVPKGWYVLHGTADRLVPIDEVRRFVGGIANAHVTEIDGASHTSALGPSWLIALDSALDAIWVEHARPVVMTPPKSVTMGVLEGELQQMRLPFEYRWPSAISAFLLFYSGDGGWASLDDGVAEQLAAGGIGIVGVSSLRYFWAGKPPAQVASDMQRIVSRLAETGRPVFVGGYSFGAEIVPVTLKDIPDRRKLAGLVLIAPGLSASFEVDPLDWVRTPAGEPGHGGGPAVRETGLPALCLAGTEETETPCPLLAGVTGVTVARLPGSHHFDDDYTAVAAVISRFIKATTAAEKHP